MQSLRWTLQHHGDRERPKNIGEEPEKCEMTWTALPSCFGCPICSFISKSGNWGRKSRPDFALFDSL